MQTSRTINCHITGKKKKTTTTTSHRMQSDGPVVTNSSKAVTAENKKDQVRKNKPKQKEYTWGNGIKRLLNFDANIFKFTHNSLQHIFQELSENLSYIYLILFLQTVSSGHLEEGWKFEVSWPWPSSVLTGHISISPSDINMHDVEIITVKDGWLVHDWRYLCTSSYLSFLEVLTG